MREGAVGFTQPLEAASRAALRLMSATTTRTPLAASAAVIPRSKPPAAPVTKTILSVKLTFIMRQH